MRISSVIRAGMAFVLAAALFPAAVSAQRNRGSSWSNDDRGPKETETVDKTVAFPVNGTLRLKNFSGDIHITGTSGHEIVLRARRRAGREQLDHIKLDIQTSGSTVTINANKQDAEWEHSHHNNNVVETAFELQVPSAANLDIDAFSSDVTIEGIDGDQALKTFSGDIRVNGPKGAMNAETFSADIAITVDSNATGSVSFNTFSGDLESALSITSTSWRKHDVEGTLPGGAGRPLKFKTFSGDLQIKTK